MIHAYNKYYLPIIQTKMGEMFEIACFQEKKEADSFAKDFISSPISIDFAMADSIRVLGSSSIELVSEILGTSLSFDVQPSGLSPEYWVGSTWGYLQWYYHMSFSDLYQKVPPSSLLPLFFPYHEMDVRHILDEISDQLCCENKLKSLRQARQISQSDLSILSGVPLRSIKAYEQGSIDLSLAQGETLYLLAQTLGCRIDDLILS